MITCDICLLTFASRRNLQRHYKVIHKKEILLVLQGDLNKYVNKCILGCEISFCYIKNLIVHLKNVHNVVINKEEWIFASFEEFTVWINQMSNKESCTYIQKTSRRIMKDKTLVYLHCSYSGYYQKYERHVKTKNRVARGSKKLNFACTSHMIATIWPDNTTSVEYWKDHYGHLENLTNINLTKLKTIHKFQKCISTECFEKTDSANYQAISCKEKSKRFKQQTAAIKKNFVQTILNLQNLNDKQLSNIYRKSVYLKRYSKEIIIHQDFGITGTQLMLKDKRDKKELQILTNQFSILDEFLVFNTLE